MKNKTSKIVKVKGKEKRDELALTIASMMGHFYHKNYADGLAETARIYEQMTGENLDSDSLQKTADEINGRNKKSFWQRLLTYKLTN